MNRRKKLLANFRLHLRCHCILRSHFTFSILIFHYCCESRLLICNQLFRRLHHFHLLLNLFHLCLLSHPLTRPLPTHFPLDLLSLLQLELYDSSELCESVLCHLILLLQLLFFIHKLSVLILQLLKVCL
jgi:hypothetical protein